jgi:O-acetylhomoserine/O-acetylserine sulfhydrylase-like pyridoxal-dependent enzyme
MENDYQTISISIDHNMIAAFFYFLERGVKKEIAVGCDIKTMLSDQFNMSTDYIDNRIKTMFLEGRPVDDVNATIINNGATLALSAAMPGLAGATFRRSENIKASTKTIELKKKVKNHNLQKGIITIKLFNLILREFGPSFLESGVLVSKQELTEFLLRQENKIENACKFVKINKNNATIEALKHISVEDESELLKIDVRSV